MAKFSTSMWYIYLQQFQSCIERMSEDWDFEAPRLPSRQFDPEKIANKFTQSIKFKPIIHTDDRFEEILQSARTFEEVQDFVKLNLNLEELQRFNEYKEQRLRRIPQNVLVTSYITEASKEIKTKQTHSQNQSELDKFWILASNTFINTLEVSSSQKNTEFKTSQGQIVSAKEIIESPGITSQDTKFIPVFPTDEIVLKVTDIPPLDVFYSPLHKAVVRKQRKIRRIETPLVMSLWKLYGKTPRQTQLKI